MSLLDLYIQQFPIYLEHVISFIYNYLVKSEKDISKSPQLL